MSTPVKKTKTVQPSSKKKGDGVRPRRVLRDNIQGITNPALRRILHRAGVKRISSLVYEELRGILRAYLNDLVRDISLVAVHERKKTVKLQYLELALRNKDTYLGAGLRSSQAGALKTCRALTAGLKKTKSENTEKRRAKPGAASAREIKFQQKFSDCLIIPATNFKRLTSELSQEYGPTGTFEDFRWPPKVLQLLQLALEDYLVKLCQAALLCSEHDGRNSVYPKDFALVLKVTELTV